MTAFFLQLCKKWSRHIIKLATSPSLYIKEFMKKFIDCMYPSHSKSTNHYGEINSGVIRKVNYIDFLCQIYNKEGLVASLAYHMLYHTSLCIKQQYKFL